MQIVIIDTAFMDICLQLCSFLLQKKDKRYRYHCGYYVLNKADPIFAVSIRLQFALTVAYPEDSLEETFETIRDAFTCLLTL